MKDLELAARQIEDALERYHNTSLVIANICLSGENSPDTTIPPLTNMTSTLRLIALYKNKIAQTEATFAQRNSLFQIAPINALPDELLSHIFQLALMPHCSFRDIIDPLAPIELPTHAKSLSQVCSRWRRVTMDSPNRYLWTHIDLALFHPFRGELVTRGAISASRAKDMTLDAHIFEQLGHPKNPDSEADNTAGADAPDVGQSEFTGAIITFADTDRPVVGDEFNPAWRLDVAEMEIMDLLCSIKALDSHCDPARSFKFSI
ncbi:Ras and EF-hand domain-containing protein [Ceratobasidium theobromae]|uniref:Ras and EF-hand domain-containing protein n=1 Tax=Ceratobasidium theobromae TaxID=1582974 RepID=A0A5N5QNZ5_9AGAM|nr:Ras and EF-hand domain-containing protein [Ceratobasidium theobromae]